MHLKFTVHGRKHGRSYIYIHTHLRNAVPLVWGSLRLAPINCCRWGEVFPRTLTRWWIWLLWETDGCYSCLSWVSYFIQRYLCTKWLILIPISIGMLCSNNILGGEQIFPLTTNDTFWCRQILATCYQLVQSILKIGSALAERVG